MNPMAQYHSPLSHQCHLLDHLLYKCAQGRLCLSLLKVCNYKALHTLQFLSLSFVADVDYASLVQDITFASGVISNVFTVTIFNDSLSENDESFEVFLKPSPDVTIGQPSVATGIIFDDEIPSKTVCNRLSYLITTLILCMCHVTYHEMWLSLMVKTTISVYGFSRDYIPPLAVWHYLVDNFEQDLISKEIHIL